MLVYSIVAMLLVIADMAMLSSTDPHLHRFGILIRSLRQPLPVDAAPLDLARIHDTIETRQLRDGCVAVWYRPVRSGSELLHRRGPTLMRAVGVPVSALIRRSDDHQQVEIRIRVAVPLVLLAFFAYMLYLLAYLGLPWWSPLLPVAAILVYAFVAVTALEDVASAIRRVAPTTPEPPVVVQIVTRD